MNKLIRDFSIRASLCAALLCGITASAEIVATDSASNSSYSWSPHDWETLSGGTGYENISWTYTSQASGDSTFMYSPSAAEIDLLGNRAFGFRGSNEAHPYPTAEAKRGTTEGIAGGRFEVVLKIDESDPDIGVHLLFDRTSLSQAFSVYSRYESGVGYRISVGDHLSRRALSEFGDPRGKLIRLQVDFHQGAYLVTVQESTCFFSTCDRWGQPYQIRGWSPSIAPIGGFSIRSSNDRDVVFNAPIFYDNAEYYPERIDPLWWVGASYHWPLNGDIESSDEIWLNTDTWPKETVEDHVVVYAVYSTDGENWTKTRMAKGTPYGDNDHWYLNVGTQPTGTDLQYAFQAVDIYGQEIWDSNDGENYLAQVNPGAPVHWIGNVFHWPPSGSITDNDDIWINADSWPQGGAVSARVIYSTNGDEWYAAPMNLGDPIGYNDHWYMSMGAFFSGSTVQYAIEVIDGTGASHWDNNGGVNFQAPIN